MICIKNCAKSNMSSIFLFTFPIVPSTEMWLMFQSTRCPLDCHQDVCDRLVGLWLLFGPIFLIGFGHRWRHLLTRNGRVGAARTDTKWIGVPGAGREGAAILLAISSLRCIEAHRRLSLADLEACSRRPLVELRRYVRTRCGLWLQCDLF